MFPIELLIRHYTPELYDVAVELTMILRASGYDVQEVDHSRLLLSDFDLRGRTPVSIDRFLASHLGVPYFQVSRVFSGDGTVIGRHCGPVPSVRGPVCVIDTDVVSGESIKLATERLGASGWSAPLKLTPQQDLIDVEDLVEASSRLEGGGRCSYLLNPTFFARRTSLPASLYGEVKRVVERNVYAMAA